MGGLTDRALRRHRLVTIVALALLVLLAWGWLAAGAGMGMAAPVGPNALPAGAGAMADTMAMPAAGPAWPVVFSMWLVMMIAMMLPSAAPTILLYSRAAAHRAPAHAGPPPTALFLLGYLAVWAAASALAAGFHALLQSGGLVPAETMRSANRWLSGGVLIAAGLYQLSPLKRTCLAHCRSPGEFIARHYRPGPGGALRLGLIHGGYCLGCCWALMLLLFVGGVMNLAWIAALTLFVAAEKLLPAGRAVATIAACALIAGGAAILLV